MTTVDNPHYLSALTELREASAFVLSDWADTYTPDAPDSPGAEYLGYIRDAFVEHLDYCDDPVDWLLYDREPDWPTYGFETSGIMEPGTHWRWSALVDLGAYAVDADDDEGVTASAYDWMLRRLEETGTALVAAMRKRLCEAIESGDTDEEEG